MDDTSAIEGLWVAGGVLGDLGDVFASRLGFTSSAFGFNVVGDLVGSLMLVDNAANEELRIDGLVIGGNIMPGLSIDTESGGIGTILVRGEIGSEALATDFVEIRSGLDITLLEAGAMHANIIVKRDVAGQNVWANIRRLKTDKLLGTGNFVGTIRANSVGAPIHREFEGEGPEGSTPQIEIQGDLGDGLGTNLDFKSALVDNSGLPPLVVGGSFRALSQIIVPTDGIQGQIVFNRDNLGGAWEHLVQFPANILVGDATGNGSEPVTLSEPDYFPTHDSVGGGAAGLAPFRLHDRGSSPKNFATIIAYYSAAPGELEIACDTLTPADLHIGSVDLRFYGGLVNYAENPDHPSVQVRSRRLGSTAGWNVEQGYLANVLSSDNHVLRVFRDDGEGFTSGRQYEITLSPDPLAPVIRSAHVAGAPEIAAFTYKVSVRFGGCEEQLLLVYDLNDDGAVDELDIGDWIMMPADFNEDAAANATDLGLLLGGKEQFDLIQEELTAE